MYAHIYTYTWVRLFFADPLFHTHLIYLLGDVFHTPVSYPLLRHIFSISFQRFAMLIKSSSERSSWAEGETQ